MAYYLALPWLPEGLYDRRSRGSHGYVIDHHYGVMLITRGIGVNLLFARNVRIVLAMALLPERSRAPDAMR